MSIDLNPIRAVMHRQQNLSQLPMLLFLSIEQILSVERETNLIDQIVLDMDVNKIKHCFCMQIVAQTRRDSNSRQ